MGKKHNIFTTWIIILIITSLFFACSFRTEEDVTINNNTPYTLTVSDAVGGHFDTFTIEPNQTIIIKSSSSLLTVNISGYSGVYNIDYESGNGVVTIFRYLYEVQYKITGTANSVSVSLNNAYGETEDIDNTTPPFTYSYSNFHSSNVYISATNLGATGSVMVTIYYKDQLYNFSSSHEVYGTVTLSGSIK